MDALEELRLDGKTAVVTGPTSDLGLEAARMLARQGAHVCVVGRDAEKTEEARAAVAGSESDLADLSPSARVIIVASPGHLQFRRECAAGQGDRLPSPSRGIPSPPRPVRVLTARLSSYWLHLVTPAGAAVARPLIEGLRNATVVRDRHIRELIPIELTPSEAAVRDAHDNFARGRGG